MTGDSDLSFHDLGSAAERGLPQLKRSRTLTNSAVEFIETRPETAFGEDVAEMMGSEAPQFSSELDQFVATSKFTEENAFKESEQRMIRFKRALTGFCEDLEKRKLDKKLGIELKDPGDYRMQDVIWVAEELQSKHQNNIEARGCLGKIRRCFRRVIEHRGTLHNLLSFVPNDTYGSSICGGFTLILAAIDRAENLREEVCMALAEIPRQLQQTSTLIDIHKQSQKLKSAADSVFVAIFEVLEVIVKELAKSITRKTVTIALKGEHYAANITTAVANLGKSVKAFGDEARVCDSKRLGRMEEHTVGTRLTVEDMSTESKAFYEQYNKDRKAFAQSLEYQNRQSYRLEELPAMVNKLYHFLASSPLFDPKNGTLDLSYARKMKISYKNSPAKLGDLSSSPAGQSKAAFIDSRLALARRWIQESGLENADPRKDIDSCLGDMNSMSLGDKDRCRWIVESDEVREWLTSPGSSTLIIDAETPPQDLVNPLTAASAFLSDTISAITGFPTLAYLSQYRAIDDPDPATSGPHGLVGSLLAQLALHIAEKRPTIDVGPLLRKNKHKLSREPRRTPLAKNLNLLGRLLDELGDDGAGAAVFVVVDSASHLRGPMGEAAGAALRLLDAAVAVKVLLTGAPPPLAVAAAERCLPRLYLPDHVDGGASRA